MAVAREKPYKGITPLEPYTSWTCPDCPYRITDERSVVNDAVLEHQRAHKEGATWE